MGRTRWPLGHELSSAPEMGARAAAGPRCGCGSRSSCSVTCARRSSRTQARVQQEGEGRGGRSGLHLKIRFYPGRNKHKRQMKHIEFVHSQKRKKEKENGPWIFHSCHTPAIPRPFSESSRHQVGTSVLLVRIPLPSPARRRHGCLAPRVHGPVPRLRVTRVWALTTRLTRRVWDAPTGDAAVSVRGGRCGGRAGRRRVRLVP